MLPLKDIRYETVPRSGMIAALRSFPNGDCAFDYETYNVRNGELAKEPWDEDTHPFIFSVCTLDNPENTLKIFYIDGINSDEKAALAHFLASRRVWAFNCKFEGAVTSKLLGKFTFFDDVQCLYKVDGRFINEMSLKKGTAQLKNVPEWADATWDTYEALQGIVGRVQDIWVKKRKTNEMVETFLEADVRKLYRLIKYKKDAEISMTKKDLEFCELLLKIEPYLTPQLILAALTASRMDSTKITLKQVTPEIVERYAAYDAYATACCYNALYGSCNEQYPFYIKQAHLAMIMEAYGMTRDLSREAELEAHYQTQILYYLKEILKIKPFSDMLKITYYVQETNPATGRLKKMEYERTGLELEDASDIEETVDYEYLKEKYYNYNARAATHKNPVKIFYDALFSSEKAYSAIIAYHIKKTAVQVEGFTEMVDGHEMHRARNLKWDTDESFLTEITTYVENKHKSSKKALSEKAGSNKRFGPRTDFATLGLTEEDHDVVEYKKWAKMAYNIKKAIEDALALNIAPPLSEDSKEKNLKSEDIRLSLRKENLEIMYSALSECADMEVDIPGDEMAWEMRLVFCCKTLKKLDKALTSYIRGKVGQDRIRKCVFGESLLNIPARTAAGDGVLFQTSFNDCSADTKRWKSPIHAIPRGCELSEMIVPRFKDSILVHYDYCWHKDTKIKLLNGQVKTIEDLYNAPNKYKVYSYDSNNKSITVGTVKEVRKVRREAKLLEITLNNGFKLRLTKEHNLYLRGYVKTKAIDLKVGDSVLSLYSKIDTWYAGGGYESHYTTLDNRTGSKNKWRPTHKQIAFASGIWSDDEVYVHHRDSNKLNNDPENLEQMTPSAHFSHHLTDWHKTHKEEFKTMRKSICQTEEFKQKMHENVKRQWMNNRKQKIEGSRKGGAAAAKKYNSDPYAISRRKEGMSNNSKLRLKETFDSLVNAGYSIEEIRQFSNKNKFNAIIKKIIQKPAKGYGYDAIIHTYKTMDNFINAYNITEDNHKILQISEVDYNAWVYTVEIEEDHHNYFVIASDNNMEMVLSSNSQSEVRIIAALAEELDLLSLFKDNPKADVHRLMASRVWNKKPEDVSGEERRASKGLVFGSLYGMSLESMADTYFESNITVARDVYTKFFTAYPKILTWCNAQHKQIEKHGYVYTIFGDKIWIESKSRGELHRRSQNYPVQSSSSTIAGYGIWNVWEQCQAEKIEAIPQCFIHDSSDWDVRLTNLIQFIKIVNKCAVEDLGKQFNVPMKIDFEIGVNLNFTMHLENPEFDDGKAHFEFKCPEIFYQPLMDRLALSYAIEVEIKDETIETESWANLFVTKRPYSMYINRPIKVFSGGLVLKPKFGYID